MKKILLIMAGVCLSVGLYAQNVAISGKVSDATTHEPIPGATVIEVGTANGAITDGEGNYALNLPEDATIIVEMVGFSAQEVAVAGKSVINVALEIDALNVDDIVVVGYGATKKADLTSAISTKDIGDSFKSRPGGLISSLQGQIAGVNISNNGVVIRGQGSRNGETPLYVVDGVPGAPYNEEDVTNITVLKDAASAAIYGATAGTGGVILITTKRATTGKTQVSAKASYGIQMAANMPSVLTAEQYNMVVADMYTVSGVAVPSHVQGSIYEFGQTTHTDWLDEIYQTGNTSRYSVSMSGGSEAVNAYASAEYTKTKGILINNFSEGFGGKVNVNFKVNDWFQIQQKLNVGYSNSQYVNNTMSAMKMPSSATVYEVDRDGNVIYDEQGNTTYAGTVPSWAVDLGVAGGYGEVVNPVADSYRYNNYAPTTTIFSTTSFVLDPIKHLKIRSDVSVNTTNSRSESFSYKRPEVGMAYNRNYRTVSSGLSFGYLWETSATYDRTFGKHSVNGMFAFTTDYNNARSNSTTVWDFEDEDIYAQQFVNGTNWSETKPTESFWENSSYSFVARASYSYDDRYFLTGSVRRDASSKLYIDNNSGVFPAVSGAWKISSEKFMQNQNAVSFLKVRASWGQIGNINSVDNYSSTLSLSRTDYATYLGAMADQYIQGYSINGLVNTDLTWETAEQTDLGFDIGLLKNRLSFTLDWFRKDTKDLIDEIPTPATAGVEDAPLGNIGSVRNQGYEFTIGWADKTASGFSYAVSANLTTIDSYVTSLGDREYMHHDNSSRSGQYLMRSVVGQPWYSFYLVDCQGVFQTQAEIDAYTWTNPETGDTQLIQPNAKPGDLKFADANDDGQISDDDRVYQGSNTPKLTYGISANFEYKGFDLSFTLTGVSGNKIYNGIRRNLYDPTQGWNMSSEMLDSWAYNKDSGIPLLQANDTNNNIGTASNYFLEDGDYFRLKNLTVGYTLPQKLFARSSWKPNVRVYFSGENLFTITDYKGFDPDVANYGIDQSAYALSRILTFGITLGF